MKPRILVVTIVAALLVASLVAPAMAKGGTNIVVTLRGPGELLVGDDSPKPGQLCYPGQLVNTKTDKVIGGGVDCLAGIDVDPATGIITLDRTTFFFFPQGTMVAQGRTTVAPVLEGSPGFTHIVGDITAGDNIATEYGTGVFTDASGSVRLSGAVDMTNFNGGLPGGVVVFNCIFVIDLD